MEKLEKLEKVKILQNGQEIDAYLNIAENVHSRIFGKTFDDVTLTIFGEFLDEDNKQVVTEYDGERRAMEISRKLQQKRIDDEEIMKFEEAREQKLVDNLPKFYQMDWMKSGR